MHTLLQNLPNIDVKELTETFAQNDESLCLSQVSLSFLISIMELIGIEPTASALQKRRSPN